MKKVIIDVDTGIDDALALVTAFKSKKLDVLGVTTVAGNVSVDLATKNTLKVLKILEEDHIEVYEGCSKPLVREGGFEEAVHGEKGLAGQLMSMETKEKNELNAVDFIIKEVNKRPGTISLILLGPLTNFASVLREDPSIQNKLKDVYIMGGAFTVSGNTSPVAEFNFYADPEAAYEVIKSGVKPKIVGLDVTSKARLYEEDLRDLNKDKDLGLFINNIASFYIERSSIKRNDKSCALHDPLVVASAIDESMVTYREDFVDIEYSSRLCDGQSICYNNKQGYVANAKIATSHDDKKFKKMFLEILSY